MPPSLYTRAWDVFGMSVAHVNRVLAQQFGGDYLSRSEQEQFEALQSYTQQRGGILPPYPEDQEQSMSQIMGGPVARHMARATGQHIKGQVPPGHFQYGNIAYPEDVMGYSLGWSVSGGQVTTGTPLEKVQKTWRQTGQQGPMAWFQNLPVEQAGITAQMASVPEPIQRVQALLTFGPTGPEGTGYFDPNLGQQGIPFTERVLLPQSVNPQDISLQAGQAIPTRGTPLSAFPGHTGFLKPQFESASVTNVGVEPRMVGGREYNELIVQGLGAFPQGSPFPSKFGPKVGAVAMPGLEEATGAQFVAPWRDPMTNVAIMVGSMSQEQRMGVFGREVTKWSPELYQEAVEKFVIPNIREHWLPQQTFQTSDPITQELVRQGALRNVQQVGEGAISAERRVVGVMAPFGIQPQAPWQWHRGVLSRETASIIQRVHGEGLYQHLEDIAAPRLASLQDVGAAYMANVSPRSQYATVGAGNIDWTSAYAGVVSQLRERGMEPGAAQPGMIGQLLMKEVSNLPEVRGKGIAFPVPGGGQVIMPNPASVERYGGNTPVEGMPWGLYKRYSSLMEEYQRYSASGGESPELAEAYKKTALAAFSAEKGSLQEITSSPEYFRATAGGMPVGQAQFGGRFAPLDALQENRWFTGKGLLSQALAPHLAKGVNSEDIAERIIMGQEVGPRAMIWREPQTMPEEQLKTVLGFTSFPELQGLIPGLTREKYEQMGTAIRVSPLIAPEQGGDWDWDPYTGTIVTRYDRGGMEHLASQSTPESIRELAASHPAGEVQSLLEKMQAITTKEQAAEFLRNAPQTYSMQDVTAQFAKKAEAQAGIGGIHSAFLRRLSKAIPGTSEAATKARGELGTTYMVGQEMGVLSGAPAELQGMIMNMSSATFGGVAPSGELRNWQNPAMAMASIFENVAQWKEISPGTRGVLLGGVSSGQAIAEQIKAYEAGDITEQTEAVKKMMRIATGQQKPTYQQFARVSPLGQVIAEGAAYRGGKRAGTTWQTASGATRGYYPGAETEELASRGSARQGYLSTFYSSEPLEVKMEALQEAVSQGIIPPEEAQAIQKTMVSMSLGAAPTTAERVSGSEIPATQAAAGGGGEPPSIPTPTAPSGAAPPGRPPSRGGGGPTGQPPGRGNIPPTFGGMMVPGEGAVQGYSKIWGDPQSGYHQYTQISPVSGMTDEQRAVITAIDKYKSVITKRAQQIEEAINSGADLNKEQIKLARTMGQWEGEMRKASNVVDPTQAAEATGARRQLGEWGAGPAAAYAGVQTQMQAAGIVGPGGSGGIAGTGRNIYQQFQKLAVGWAPFQMRRAWSMLGAPVFNQMIPAAAGAELAGWGLTQGIGGFDAGMPEGVAGGLLQYQAAQRQSQIEGGRAGYRSWGWTMQNLPGLKEVQGIAGPAAGAGLATAIGLNALGGTAAAAAGPVGLGIAGIGAGIGAGMYLQSFGEPTAENQLIASSGPLGKFGVGLGGALRAASVGYQAGGLGGGLLALGTSILGGGIDRFANKQEELGEALKQTPLGELSAQDRMAVLNDVAKELRKQEGTRWSGMDEGQILQQISRFAPYDKRLQTMSREQMLSATPGEWAYETSPQQYEQLAGQLALGAGGAMDLLQRWGGQNLYEQRRQSMMAGQWSALTNVGVEGGAILNALPQLGMLGAQGQFDLGRMLSGDRNWWSRAGRQGASVGGLNIAPEQWMITQEESGLAIGTTTGGDVLQRQLGKTGAPGQAIDVSGGQITFNVQGQQVQVDFSEWGMQDFATQQSRQQQQWQFGFQQQGLNLESSYMLGTGQFAGAGMFPMRYEQLDVQDRQFRERQALAEQKMNAQFGWQAEDMENQYGRQMTRFRWAEEDLAYRGATMSLQFGWQQEDFQENIRYATGRQRRRLMEQQERSTIMYGMQMGQLGTQRGRLDEQRGWAEEDADKARERHQQRLEWARSEMDLSRRHHDQDMELARRRLDAEKQYWQLQQERQQESLNRSREYWDLTVQIQDAQTAFARARSIQLAEFQNQWLEFFDRLEEKLSALDSSSGAGSSSYDYSPYSGPPITSGGGGNGFTPIGAE